MVGKEKMAEKYFDKFSFLKLRLAQDRWDNDNYFCDKIL